jgi:hypothetical protein
VGPPQLLNGCQNIAAGYAHVAQQAIIEVEHVDELLVTTPGVRDRGATIDHRRHDATPPPAELHSEKT